MLGYHRGRNCSLSWEILNAVWCIPFLCLNLSSQTRALSRASVKRQDKINPHFRIWKQAGQKSNTQESAWSCFKHNNSREKRSGALGNKSISGHLLSYSMVIDDLSNHLFQSPDCKPKSFSKELSLHPKQIMNNSQIDTLCFIELTCLIWVWHLAQLFFICQTSSPLPPLFGFVRR